MSYANEIKLSGPAGYWRMDAATGNVPNEGTANLELAPTAGALYSQTALTSGGQAAIDLPRGEHAIAAGGGAQLAAEGAIEVWIAPHWASSDGLGHVLVHSQNGSGNFLRVETFTDGNTYAGWAGGGSETRVVVPTPAWSSGDVLHLVLTWGGDGSRLYLNGALLGVNSAAPATVDLSGFDLVFGENPSVKNDESAADAVYDELAVYPRALSAWEVRRHYWAGKGRTGYALDVLSSGPGGYWRLEETEGTAAADESGNANVGTLLGSPTLAAQGALTPDAGRAMSFDGVDDCIDVADDASLNGTTFSVEAWVYRDTHVDYAAIVSKLARMGSADFRGFVLRNGTANQVQILAADGTAGNFTAEGGSLPLGEWSHLAATYDGTTLRLYLNGEEVASAAAGYTDTANGVVIGKQYTYKSTASSETFWQGRIDEPAVYTRALTMEEIRRHYLRGKGEKGYRLEALSSRPYAYWRLGEAAGTEPAVDEAGNFPGSYAGGLSFGEAGALANDADTAVRFSSLSTYMEVPDTDSLSFSNASGDLPFSLEAWLNAADLSSHRAILGKTQDTDHMEYYLQARSTGSVRLTLYHAGRPDAQLRCTTPDGLLTLGAWAHVVATYDGSASGGGVRLYVNGVEQAVTVEAVGSYTGMGNTTSPLRLGASLWLDATYNSFLAGLLDEPAIYGRVLTPEEVTRHYYMGLYGESAGTFFVTGAVTQDGAAAAVTLRAYRRDTGQLLGETTSDASTGVYTIGGLAFEGECDVVAIGDAGFRPLAHGPITPAPE